MIPSIFGASAVEMGSSLYRQKLRSRFLFDLNGETSLVSRGKGKSITFSPMLKWAKNIPLPLTYESEYKIKNYSYSTMLND